MINALIFIIELALIIAAIIFLINKNYMVSIVLMCTVLFIHIISNWNFLFGLILRANGYFDYYALMAPPIVNRDPLNTQQGSTMRNMGNTPNEST